MLKSEIQFDHIGAGGINVKLYNIPAPGSPGVFIRKHPGYPTDLQGVAAVEFAFAGFFNYVCHNQKL